MLEGDHAGPAAVYDPHRLVALINLAIDSKLHGCDVTAVRVDDVASNGYAIKLHPSEEDGHIESTVRYVGI